jgi:hypothetical protein
MVPDDRIYRTRVKSVQIGDDSQHVVAVSKRAFDVEEIAAVNYGIGLQTSSRLPYLMELP